MMLFPDGTRAGKISKPSGLSGSVHLILDPSAGEFIEPGNPLFIEIDGQRVPFFLEEYEQVSADQAIARFEFIDSVEEARRISGWDIYLERSLRVKGSSSGGAFEKVPGYEAYDLKAGYLGKVTGYKHEEMNPLFLVSYRGDEIMVPAVREIISNINHRERTIHFDLPEGLLGL